MPPERVVIVGAGVSGLTAAAELAGGCRVTVLDRLPVGGGVLGYEDPFVEELQERAGAAGAQWMLGATAVRWVGGRVLTVGPDGVSWLECDRLIYAGGSRPATQAELGIAGPRLAGVLPATVALHFAEAGVLLGRRVVFVGSGDHAHAAARVIAEQDCEITVVAPTDSPAPSFRHEALFSGWSASGVSGVGRVSSLTLARSGVEHRIRCDAVILAADPRPLRNVDGAVVDPSDGVAFVQPIGERALARSVAAQASTATRSLLSEPKVEVRV